LYHLRASLEGAACQVLWDAGKQSSVDDVIRLLKSHFGSSNEEEQYRSEVRSRQRRRGESLQSVYRDIRRIMALAFPGQSGSLWDCDAFVDALANRNLRYRILERDPSTLEEAFNVASGLEALSCSVGDTDPDVCWDESGRRRIRQSCSAAHVDDEIKLRQLIGELCEERRHTKEKMENLCRWQRQESEALRQSMEVEMLALLIVSGICLCWITSTRIGRTTRRHRTSFQLPLLRLRVWPQCRRPTGDVKRTAAIDVIRLVTGRGTNHRNHHTRGASTLWSQV